MPEHLPNELIVFPAPQTQAYGVHLNYVENATYFKGRNQKEAVAAAVKAHFKNTPHLSLGVATFNSKQQELIAELLDSWLEAQRNTISAEPFFIKNLENVQGDERDVIFKKFWNTRGGKFLRFGQWIGLRIERRKLSGL
ncbi:MAG: hypothetical protein ABFS56_27080 [Pseudomonadota bacterium]